MAKADPTLHGILTTLYDAALGEGTLDAKTKVLIALALDTMVGASSGVSALTGIAKGMGVSDQEIAEVLRIVYLVSSNQVLGTSTSAYNMLTK